MRIERVVVDGFKSFGTYTEVAFPAGLTAIVGPNGCGKSNLLDAILWAAGSRRWKSLRGGEMEDVIFGGTDAVPPAERALVRVVFENDDRRLGFDADAVEISRELARGGAGQAFLAGTPVRLKDVQAVVAGTGLGDDGFAIIRQGQIDRVILSSGDELRQAIEEAAGIARYRLRRAEAQERLDRVGRDLEEIKRRIDRMRREIKGVKDQAARARKRGELTARLAEIRESIRVHEASLLEAEIGEMSAQGGRLTARRSQLETGREELLADRRRIEDGLAAPGETPGPSLRALKGHRNVGAPGEAPAVEVPRPAEVGPADVIRLSSLIEEEGRQLIDAARTLRTQGPEGWHAACVAVQDAASRLLGGISPGRPPSPKPRRGESAGILKGLTARIEEATGELLRVTAEVAAVEVRLAQVREQRAALGDVAAATTPVPKDAGILHIEAREIEGKLAGLGPVDETAPAREEELKREIAHWATQRDDLDAARAKLTRFIADVDAHAGYLFTRTLERTGRSFSGHVDRLFGGGWGRLARTEGGRIVVAVKLPDKKECELSLLSGGEKSLAGIALVLALASAGGAKSTGGVLILDEVDAPLDEANAVRFARLLGEIARENQVLAVTHNPRTMEAASEMLGVSTSLDGTSAILAVRLDRARVRKLAAIEVG